MNNNPLKVGLLTENSVGIGTVTRKMVRERAMELAATDGRPEAQASKSDWDQAKRELTGQTDTDPKALALELAAESERWDPLAGSTGFKVPVAQGEDEDEEGRSDNQRLVEEGVAGAGFEQTLESAKADGRVD